MTAAAPPPPPTAAEPPIRARRAGLGSDLTAIGLRALRAAWRDPEAVIPPIFVGAFFFAINVGSLQSLSEQQDPGFDYKAFQLATAVVLTITGVTRAYGLVLDIQNGYFDKLALSPARRSSLLLGHMVADFVLAIGLTLAVTAVAMVVGFRFVTGPPGVLAFSLLAGRWSVAHARSTVAGAVHSWLRPDDRREPGLAGMASTLSATVLRGRRYSRAHVGD